MENKKDYDDDDGGGGGGDDDDDDDDDGDDVDVVINVIHAKRHIESLSSLEWEQSSAAETW